MAGKKNLAMQYLYIMSDNFKEFKNPWSADNSEWFGEEKDKWFDGGEFFEALNTFTGRDSFSSLADAAEFLGNQNVVMKSYWDFQTSKYDWFFSPNPKLESATKKPKSFKNWKDWESFNSKIRKTIGNIAGFNKNVTDVQKNDTDLKKLISAYNSWKSTLYSIHWSNDNTGGSWMCNVFVGDAIYLFNNKSITNSKIHYYDPKEITSGKGPFKKVKPQNVRRGVIVAFGTTHMEIVTSLKKFLIADDGFCSIGAGRSDENSTGSVRCDSTLNPFGTREIENDNNSYYLI